MSNNPDYISLSSSPILGGNSRGGRNNRPYFNRGFNSNTGQRFSGFRNSSPYNRGPHRNNFNNTPRFDRPQDISAWYHPSMMQDPWKRLEAIQKSNNTSLNNSSSSKNLDESVDESNSDFSKSSNSICDL